MDCKELRIGNWVYFKLDDEYLEFDYSMLDWDNASDIHAIPITEEWLVKLGFEIKEDRAVNRYWKGEFLYDLKDRTFNMFFSMDEGTFFIKMEYIHQLQNLYYALTGTELVCKSQ